jgi:hypothetical protein
MNHGHKKHGSQKSPLPWQAHLVLSFLSVILLCIIAPGYFEKKLDLLSEVVKHYSINMMYDFAIFCSKAAGVMASVIFFGFAIKNYRYEKKFTRDI